MDDHLPHAIRRFLADEPYRQLSPDELWSRFRDHADEGALRVLLERVGGRIYARCRAVVGDDPTADEAFQEAFAELFRHRAKLPTYGAAVAWLYVTATNKARAHRRWWRRVWRRERARAAIQRESAPPMADRELAERVGRALTDLPERERQAIELVYLEGMTHDQAATALGMGRGSVGNYVLRGLERLRRSLERRGAVAVSGVAAVEAALRAAPQSVPVTWLSAVATHSVAAESAPPALCVSWKVMAGLALGAGLAAAGSIAFAPVVPGPVPNPAPALPPETVPARTLRVFEEAVLPIQLDALRPAVLGGDDPQMVAVETLDTRVAVTFALPHRTPDGKRLFASQLQLVNDTARRKTWAFFDPTGSMGFRELDPSRPLILFRSQWLGQAVSLPSESLRAAIAAFDVLPGDERTAAEAADYQMRLDRAIRPFVGQWYSQGRDEFPCHLEWRPGEGITLSNPKSHFSLWLRVETLRVDANGVVQWLDGHRPSVRFATDGRRLELLDPVDWWVREPVPPEKR